MKTNFRLTNPPCLADLNHLATGVRTETVTPDGITIVSAYEFDCGTHDHFVARRVTTNSLHCSRCGGNAHCLHYGDVSHASTIYVLYFRVCNDPSCGHYDQEAVSGGDTSFDDWMTICPYCGQPELV